MLRMASTLAPRCLTAILLIGSIVSVPAIERSPACVACCACHDSFSEKPADDTWRNSCTVGACDFACGDNCTHYGTGAGGFCFSTDSSRANVNKRSGFQEQPCASLTGFDTPESAAGMCNGLCKYIAPKPPVTTTHFETLPPTSSSTSPCEFQLASLCPHFPSNCTGCAAENQIVLESAGCHKARISTICAEHEHKVKQPPLQEQHVVRHTNSATVVASELASLTESSEVPPTKGHRSAMLGAIWISAGIFALVGAIWLPKPTSLAGRCLQLRSDGAAPRAANVADTNHIFVYI
jgi:hypothetical protein